MGTLKDKTVLLVTHQVDFLHNVDSIMVCICSQVSNSSQDSYLSDVGLNSTRVLAANTPPHASARPNGPEAWTTQA